ncbi:thermonuclease family protein [Microbacterium sp. YY-01]|uniref:thermonuclease family protein n=1 Tax=Microbacterium sp. YY-01 TaxID=3421634 RepID=UPI003D171293
MVVLAAAAMMLASCLPEPIEAPRPPTATQVAHDTSRTTPSPTPSSSPDATLISVTDGDTIVTSDGIVRIIGIDAPERGECGYRAATDAIRALIAVGDPVVLEHPEGQNDRDRYDRMLRYVAAHDGTDIGLMQLEAGNAVARYDSLDGYPRHPKQEEYRAVEKARLDSSGRVVTAECALAVSATPTPAASATASPTPTPTPVATAYTEPWYMKYPSCAALKRNTVGDPTGPFNRDDPAEADIYDWFQYGTGFRGDGDFDGLACE